MYPERIPFVDPKRISPIGVEFRHANVAREGHDNKDWTYKTLSKFCHEFINDPASDEKNLYLFQGIQPTGMKVISQVPFIVATASSVAPPLGVVGYHALQTGREEVLKVDHNLKAMHRYEWKQYPFTLFRPSDRVWYLANSSRKANTSENYTEEELCKTEHLSAYWCLPQVVAEKPIPKATECTVTFNNVQGQNLLVNYVRTFDNANSLYGDIMEPAFGEDDSSEVNKFKERWNGILPFAKFKAALVKQLAIEDIEARKDYDIEQELLQSYVEKGKEQALREVVSYKFYPTLERNILQDIFHEQTNIFLGNAVETFAYDTQGKRVVQMTPEDKQRILDQQIADGVEKARLRAEEKEQNNGSEKPKKRRKKE